MTNRVLKRITISIICVFFSSILFYISGGAYNYESNFSRAFKLKIERENLNKQYKVSFISKQIIRSKVDNLGADIPTNTKDEIRCRLVDNKGNLKKTLYYVNPVSYGSKIVDPVPELNETLNNANEKENTKINIANKNVNYNNSLDEEQLENGLINVIVENYLDAEKLFVDVKEDNLTYINIGEFDIRDTFKEKALALAPEEKPSEIGDTVKIIYNGEDKNKLVIVFLAEGYTVDEQDKFIRDVKMISGCLKTERPFSDFYQNINVYAVKVVSEDSGTGEDQNHTKNTYFKSAFNYENIDRALYAQKSDLAFDIMNKYVPYADTGVILVNTEKYGGTGGSISTLSVNSYSRDVFLHELGHTLCKLADEYKGGGNEERANLTKEKDPEKVKWKSYIGTEGVGIYSVKGGDNGWYRPSEKCKMSSLGDDFCPICRDAFIERILKEIGIPPSKGNRSFLSEEFDVKAVNEFEENDKIKLEDNGKDIRNNEVKNEQNLSAESNLNKLYQKEKTQLQEKSIDTTSNKQVELLNDVVGTEEYSNNIELENTFSRLDRACIPKNLPTGMNRSFNIFNIYSYNR